MSASTQERAAGSIVLLASTMTGLVDTLVPCLITRVSENGRLFELVQCDEADGKPLKATGDPLSVDVKPFGWFEGKHLRNQIVVRLMVSAEFYPINCERKPHRAEP
jgi:hypothetical protein